MRRLQTAEHVSTNQSLKQMKTQLTKWLLISMLIGTFQSCKEEEVPYFSGENSANFWQHLSNFSFLGATTQEKSQDTVILNIALVGQMVDRDRIVDVVAVEDDSNTPIDEKLTTASPSDYKILGGKIAANQQHGQVKVVVKNPESLAESNSDLKLRLEIVPNQDFGSGLSENSALNLRWSREILPPTTWNAMRFFFCATYSTRVYKIFMEVTGLREFNYYAGEITREEALVLGKKFGDKIRELSALQGSPLLHDDGQNKGLPIVPVY